MSLTATRAPCLLLGPIPFSSIRVLQPALLARVRSPAVQTDPDLIEGPKRIQDGHQSCAQPAVLVVDVDLIGSAFP